jgi:hypothetical protein
MATKKGMTTNFPPLSFVEVFGSGIRDLGSGIREKHPRSATLIFSFKIFHLVKKICCAIAAPGLLCHNIMRAIRLQKLSGKVASILKRFID